MFSQSPITERLPTDIRKYSRKTYLIKCAFIACKREQLAPIVSRTYVALAALQVIIWKFSFFCFFLRRKQKLSDVAGNSRILTDPPGQPVLFSWFECDRTNRHPLTRTRRSYEETGSCCKLMESPPPLLRWRGGGHSCISFMTICRSESDWEDLLPSFWENGSHMKAWRVGGLGGGGVG